MSKVENVRLCLGYFMFNYLGLFLRFKVSIFKRYFLLLFYWLSQQDILSDGNFLNFPSSTSINFSEPCSTNGLHTFLQFCILAVCVVLQFWNSIKYILSSKSWDIFFICFFQLHSHIFNPRKRFISLDVYTFVHFTFFHLSSTHINSIPQRQ